MTGLLLALVGAYGVHLLYTAVALRWTGVRPGPAPESRSSWRQRLVRSGLDVHPGQALGATLGAALAASALGWTVFGGVLPPLLAGLAGSSLPWSAVRGRRARRRAAAQDSWPRLIEEVRIRTSTLGRSIPQALFEAGRSAPAELRGAFRDARREWLLSTDLERTLGVLREALADPTADAVCETLLVAHQVGGGDLDRVLHALVEDRILDLQGRRDARARQAGARFARSFTLVVPVGMALVGLSIGQGRAAYGSSSGQALVALGIAVMVLCWAWAGRVLRLPDEHRVFAGGGVG